MTAAVPTGVPRMSVTEAILLANKGHGHSPYEAEGLSGDVFCIADGNPWPCAQYVGVPRKPKAVAS